jgi:hypothetical protein
MHESPRGFDLKTKRKSYKPPRHWLANPLNILRVSASMQQADVARLDVEARTAWERLRAGVGSESDWDVCADVANLCSVLGKNISPKVLEVAQAAARSLQVMQDRRDTSGTWGACHLSLAAIPGLLDLHHEFLKNCTPKQLMDALHEAKSTQQRGVHAIDKTVRALT